MAKLADLVNGIFLSKTRVQGVERLTPHYFKVTTDAVAYAPGDKAQVRVADWGMRTYTPFGATQFLVFHHGEGPAAKWIHGLKAGDTMELLGPRKSIGFGELKGPQTLFGDETSIAAAVALRSIPSQASAPVFLEVTNAEETNTVLAKLGLSNVNVFQRAADDSHLNALTNAMRGSSGGLVLTGKAQSIQHVRKLLGVERSRIEKTKAYWSVGRAGLD